MSEFRVDQITNQSGTAGPNLAGITTFSATSGMLMPSGDTRYRYFYGKENIVTNGISLWLDAGNKTSYPGSGTAWTDLSGLSNNQTLVNGVGFNSGNGGSLVFDGVDDYSSGSALSGSFSSFSIMVWFYPTVVENYRNVLDCNYGYYASSANVGPRLEMNSNGTLGWVYSNNTNFNYIFYAHDVVSSGLPANSWCCASITYDGSINSSTTYYNGNNSSLLRSNVNNATGFVGSINSPNIGRGFSASRHFKGGIGNVLIYDRALTQQEILQNFNALRSRYGV